MILVLSCAMAELPSNSFMPKSQTRFRRHPPPQESLNLQLGDQDEYEFFEGGITEFLKSNLRTPPAYSAIAYGENSKTPDKRPSIGQKKPLETLGSLASLSSSKKQKVSGTFMDQSVEQLCDVTFVSGINLREEGEQLFSGPKEYSHYSEASPRVVQEGEKLILEKIPLQQKLAEIMANSGLKNIGNDVEHCLSLCVEERMRRLISNLIRFSKQRMDIEKSFHKTIITADVHQQIMSVNRKAREECKRKQAETELQRLNEPKSNPAVDGQKDKDKSHGKARMENKEKDDKMRTNAANLAARAALGGDDILSKWKLMVQKHKHVRVGVTTREHQKADKRGQSDSTSTPGAVRNVGRSQVTVPQNMVFHSISIKDVISVLESETQMSKSTLVYKLYEKKSVMMLQQNNAVGITRYH